MVLLEQARRPQQRASDSLSGKSDGLNNRELLKALMRIVDEDYLEPPHSTFKQNCSEFRACRLSSSTYIPLDDPDIIEQFNQRVCNKYASVLGTMGAFVNSFLAPGDKRLLLAQRLLGLVAADSTISNDHTLYVTLSGEPISKSELLHSPKVCLEAVLVGLWHYIVMSVPDNTQGRKTFEYWHEKPIQTRSRWRLATERIPLHDAGLELISLASEHISTNNSEPAETITSGADTGESEIVDAEIVEEDDQTDSCPETDSQDSSEGARVVVFQGGTNNTNIGHVETLNLGRWS